MELLTVYILCHNRPDYARQAITSVLAQSSQAFKLIVSDNSSNDDVERMVKNELPSINYIRRLPIMALWEHFNCCIGEVQSKYFCLFHDDDVMSPDFIKIVLQCLSDYPDTVALGCNAKMENAGKLESRTSFRSFRKLELIETPLKLARRYFSRAQSGFAPFPSYIYNRSLVGEQRLPLEGGKYADVTWLLCLASKGVVIWVNMPLMTYRIHEGNIGIVESPRDRLRFLGFLKQNLGMFDKNLLADYRCSFIYKKIIKAHVGTQKQRSRVAISFLKYYRWNRYFRIDTFRSLAVRLLVKLVAK